MSYCKFCDERIIKEFLIGENETCIMLTLDGYIPSGILEGSVVIFTKAHKETPFELTDKELSDTFDLLRKAKSVIDEKHAPHGYNAGWNIGKVGGQEIFHVHLNVMPRYEDEPLAGKGIRYFFKQENNKRTARQTKCEK